MKTTNDTKHTQGEPLPDTGDILTDALNDAGYWKAEAFRFKQLNAEMLAALEALVREAGIINANTKDHGVSAAIEDARAVLAKAKAKGQL